MPRGSGGSKRARCRGAWDLISKTRPAKIFGCAGTSLGSPKKATSWRTVGLGMVARSVRGGGGRAAGRYQPSVSSGVGGGRSGGGGNGEDGGGDVDGGSGGVVEGGGGGDVEGGSGGVGDREGASGGVVDAGGGGGGEITICEEACEAEAEAVARWCAEGCEALSLRMSSMVPKSSAAAPCSSPS